jgi:hypothetical protein
MLAGAAFLRSVVATFHTILTATGTQFCRPALQALRADRKIPLPRHRL